MMMKEKSSKWACAKCLCMLPLAAVAVAAFARPEVSGVSNQLSDAKITDLAAIVKEKPLETAPQDSVYSMVKQMPEYPGGMQGMFQFLKDNLKYPQEAKDKGIQGRVLLQITVDATGKVTDPKVVRGVDPLLDAEAIRVVKLMPRWTPGVQDGKAVDVLYVLPIMFSLPKDDKGVSGKLTVKVE